MICCLFILRERERGRERDMLCIHKTLLRPVPPKESVGRRFGSGARWDEQADHTHIYIYIYTHICIHVHISYTYMRHTYTYMHACICTLHLYI